MRERNFSFKIFKDGTLIDGEPITRQEAKDMLLTYYATERDVEAILNNEEVN